MIKEFTIENYKSIQKLTLNLGRVNVFIGENGCGKSNILEAFALASAASQNKLDNEFLVSRGIRVTTPELMRSAFESVNMNNPMVFEWFGNGKNPKITLTNDNQLYSKWIPNVEHKLIEATNTILSFLIYSPENSSLRTFEKEGQIEPLGIKGEGLFKLLKYFASQPDKEILNELKSYLKLFDWFKDFSLPENSFGGESFLKIKDRFLDESLEFFDQKSANEGFLFVLFYFSLLISDKTPKFFAIDNIEASLNPKLCTKLTKCIVELSEKHQKQVLLTTHSPSILDGLDLNDPEQKLFLVYRNKLGHTVVNQVEKPKPLEGQEPIKLSEAFLRGYLGGLPKNFAL